MATMTELASAGAMVAKRLAALREGARELVLPRDLQGQPLRDGSHVLGLTWEKRPNPNDAARALEARVAFEAREATAGVPVFAAVEGICRVTEGGHRFGRKTTCVVVHVTADGEPARVVLVPVE